ncbi:MAG: PspC domain-containing protein [Chloroflexi bacterium]|nr:MAG: PspC domain-containing protein [Chloroflexota bacterium]
MNGARLRRSETDRMIGGVCGGLANYLNVDPVLVRLAFVGLFFASGVGLTLYIILWIVMPGESQGQHVQVQTEANAQANNSIRESRIGRFGTVGIIMILVGIYLLSTQFSALNWLGELFWPALIIGTGIYFLLRSQN